MPKLYSKNYLEKVILRVDFNRVDLGFLSDLSAAIKVAFPVSKVHETTEGALTVEMLSGKVEKTEEKKFAWSFFNVARTKHFFIASDHMFLEYSSSYVGLAELLGDVSATIKPVLDHSSIQTINRVGLRYKNVFPKFELKKEWSDLIHSNLLNGFSFVDDASLPAARVFSQVVFKGDGFDVTFHYGLYNENFPSEITDEKFILDYDSYSVFPMEKNEFNLAKFISSSNGVVRALFEQSITEELKTILGPITE